MRQQVYIRQHFRRGNAASIQTDALHSVVPRGRGAVTQAMKIYPSARAALDDVTFVALIEDGAAARSAGRKPISSSRTSAASWWPRPFRSINASR